MVGRGRSVSKVQIPTRGSGRGVSSAPFIPLFVPQHSQDTSQEQRMRSVEEIAPAQPSVNESHQEQNSVQQNLTNSMESDRVIVHMMDDGSPSPAGISSSSSRPCTYMQDPNRDWVVQIRNNWSV